MVQNMKYSPYKREWIAVAQANYDDNAVHYQIERFNDDTTEWEVIEEWKQFKIKVGLVFLH